MGYTFLQKPSSFKFLSILEENCGADINTGTIKRKFLLTNASKNGCCMIYTFLQKLSSCKFYSILEESCGADIINRTFTVGVKLLPPPVVSGRFVGHVSRCTKFYFHENFSWTRQTAGGGGGSNLTPTVSDFD